MTHHHPPPDRQHSRAVFGGTAVAPSILSVPGATLRVMNTLSNASNTSYEIPLSEADQIALRPALLHDLGAMPFEPGALISRSLWLIFIGECGVWTHAVLPVDDRIDMPDQENITGLCDLVARLDPTILLHGHVRPLGAARVDQLLGRTIVSNVVGHRWLEIPPRPGLATAMGHRAS